MLGHDSDCILTTWQTLIASLTTLHCTTHLHSLTECHHESLYHMPCQCQAAGNAERRT